MLGRDSLENKVSKSMDKVVHMNHMPQKEKTQWSDRGRGGKGPEGHALDQGSREALSRKELAGEERW